MKNLQKIFYVVGSLMAVSAGVHWYFIFAHPEHFQLNRPAIHLHSFQMLYCTLTYFVLGFLAQNLSKSVGWIALLGVVAAEFMVFLGLKNPLWYGCLPVIFAVVFALCLVSHCRLHRAISWSTLVLICGGVGGVLSGLSLKTGAFEFYDWSITVGIFGYLMTFVVAVWRQKMLQGIWGHLALLWLTVFAILKSIAVVSQNETLLFHHNDWLHFLTLGSLGAVIVCLQKRMLISENRRLWPADVLGVVLQSAMVVRVSFGFVPALFAYRYVAAAIWTVGFAFWSVASITKRS